MSLKLCNLRSALKWRTLTGDTLVECNESATTALIHGVTHTAGELRAMAEACVDAASYLDMGQFKAENSPIQGGSHNANQTEYARDMVTPAPDEYRFGAPPQNDARNSMTMTGQIEEPVIMPKPQRGQTPPSAIQAQAVEPGDEDVVNAIDDDMGPVEPRTTPRRRPQGPLPGAPPRAQNYTPTQRDGTRAGYAE